MIVDEPKTITGQDARQGKKLGVMRYVLEISLALAVIAGIVIWTVFFGGTNP
jgi:hypothetical protein